MENLGLFGPGTEAETVCQNPGGGGDLEPTEAQLERRSRRHSTAEAKGK